MLNRLERGIEDAPLQRPAGCRDLGRGRGRLLVNRSGVIEFVADEPRTSVAEWAASAPPLRVMVPIVVVDAALAKASVVLPVAPALTVMEPLPKFRSEATLEIVSVPAFPTVRLPGPWSLPAMVPPFVMRVPEPIVSVLPELAVSVPMVSLWPFRSSVPLLLRVTVAALAI